MALLNLISTGASGDTFPEPSEGCWTRSTVGMTGSFPGIGSPDTLIFRILLEPEPPMPSSFPLVLLSELTIQRIYNISRSLLFGRGVFTNLQVSPGQSKLETAILRFVFGTSSHVCRSTLVCTLKSRGPDPDEFCSEDKVIFSNPVVDTVASQYFFPFPLSQP
ncbi:hypothetical protein D3C71_1440490 [compost metagenome]